MGLPIEKQGPQWLNSGAQRRRVAPAKTLLELPVEVLHLIMDRLPANGAVMLGGLHPTLRAALANLPDLHVALTLDAVDRRTEGGARTRTRARVTDATTLLLCRRKESFSRFLAASPSGQLTRLDLTLRVPLTSTGPPPSSASLDLDWLPLSSTRELSLNVILPPGGYDVQWHLYGWMHRCLRQILVSCSALRRLTLAHGNDHGSLWFDAYEELHGCLPASLQFLELHGSSGRMWLADCRHAPCRTLLPCLHLHYPVLRCIAQSVCLSGLTQRKEITSSSLLMLWGCTCPSAAAVISPPCVTWCCALLPFV
jgi:hypothetical protein